MKQSLISAREISRESTPRTVGAAPPWGQPPGWLSTTPAPDQELLLKSALSPDSGGLEAWQELRPRLDFDALDGAAWPVLPMLYRNLVTLDPDYDGLPRLRGIRRYLWAENQLLISEVMPLVAALELAGIPTVILKGGALIPRLDDPGLRPMRDLDVLVPETARTRAMGLLADAGLEPIGGLSRDWVQWVLTPSTPSYAFATAAGRQIDLHWHAMHESRQIGADAELWAAATAVEIAGVSTRVPAAADQLLHVVAHAMRWDPRPSYRWVLDAWLLLTEPLNFDRLIEQARRRRLSVPLHAGLSYLASTFAAPIPAEVIAALDPRRGSPIERAELRSTLTAPHARTRLARAVLSYQSQVRRSMAPGTRLTPVSGLRVAIESLRGDDPCESARPPLMLGARVQLGRAGAPGRYVARGIGLPDDHGCWTIGREARFSVPVAGAPGSARILSLSCRPYVNALHPSQRLEVVVNGQSIKTWTGSRGSGSLPRCTVVLPRSAVRGRKRLDLRLRTPDACSPRSLGRGEDPRELGWFLTELMVSAVKPYKLGTELDFGADGNAEPYLAEGWWEAQDGGRWTVGSSATLMFQIECTARFPRRELAVELECTPLGASAGRSVDVDVAVNGRDRGKLVLDGVPTGGRARAMLGRVRAGRELKLSFEIANPAAPCDLGLGDDRRELGLHVRRLVLTEASRPAADDRG